MEFLSDVLSGIEGDIKTITLPDPKQSLKDPEHLVPNLLKADTEVPFGLFVAALEKAHVDKEDGECPTDPEHHLQICRTDSDPVTRAIHFVIAHFQDVSTKYCILWQVAEGL